MLHACKADLSHIAALILMHFTLHEYYRASAKKQDFDFSQLKKVLLLSELNSQFCIALNIHSDEALVSKYQLVIENATDKCKRIINPQK